MYLVAFPKGVNSALHTPLSKRRNCDTNGIFLPSIVFLSICGDYASYCINVDYIYIEIRLGMFYKIYELCAKQGWVVVGYTTNIKMIVLSP